MEEWPDVLMCYRCKSGATCDYFTDLSHIALIVHKGIILEDSVQYSTVS